MPVLAKVRTRSDGPDQHVAGRNAQPVEEDLALVQRALADLVERLAAADALLVEWHQEDAAARRAVASVAGAEQRGGLGDGPVRNPGGLLPGDDDLVAFASREAIRAARLRAGGAEPAREIHHVAAVIGLGDRPAADLVRREALHEVGAVQHLREQRGHARDTERDGEAGIPPAHLLRNDRADARRLER
jgi:hypothetical protein